MKTIKSSYEYIIIGSGFGGSFPAYELAKAGKEVCIIERGVWVKRDDTCWDEFALHLQEKPLYQGHTPYLVDQAGKIEADWPYDTVGGMSTFYGAAAFRLRVQDFEGPPLPDTDKRNTELAWPFNYYTLAPYYDKAEELQCVAGIRGQDITEPPRKKDYPQKPPLQLSRPSQKIWDAAIELGLHPFYIPMAINFAGKCNNTQCILCNTCDHYLCKIQAKMDLSVSVLPKAIHHGAIVLDNHRAVKINFAKNKVQSIDIINQATGQRHTIQCKYLILAAGPIATPHLLLASGIESVSSVTRHIGHNLMRHINGVVSGVVPYIANPDNTLAKRVAIADYYFGDSSGKGSPKGNWGIIQDIATPGKGVIKANAPFGLKNIAATFSQFLINQLVIAEDIPQYANRVYCANSKDLFGMPNVAIYHRYHSRDIAARNALYKVAKRVLQQAGAKIFYYMPIVTFSHALGTCRMGKNRELSAVNPECRLWDIKNCYISDASVLPTGGSVNPSLTIAANALRVTDIMLKR
jgi:choline dehydrogenase-like flavoprotein